MQLVPIKFLILPSLHRYVNTCGRLNAYLLLLFSLHRTWVTVLYTSLCTVPLNEVQIYPMKRNCYAVSGML